MASVAENKYKKRGRILDAAYELFTSKSVTETAIDDVVRLAGVAKGTFYLYFRDKYDLLDQIVMFRTSEIIVDAYKKLCERIDKSSMSVPQQFIFMTKQITEYLQKNKKVTALIDGRLFLCFSERGYAANESLNEVREHFMSLITQMRCSTEEAKRRLYVITEMISAVSCQAILSEKPFGLDEIMQTVNNLLNILLSEVNTVDK